MTKSLHKAIFVVASIVVLINYSTEAVAPCGEVIEKSYHTEVNEKIAPTIIDIGLCKITAYCRENYPHICNDGDSSTTSTGTTPTPGRTIAVDPNVIPYGSEVTINGHTYVAEDCGGAIKGNRIDILFETHQEALEFGIRYQEVTYVIKEDK